MKQLLLLLLKTLAVSVPLTWLWIEWGQNAYGALFSQLALPIYSALGMTAHIPEGARDRFINYLPFLILMLITPSMSWKRRAGGIAVGFVAIFFAHVAFDYATSLTDLPGGQIDQRGMRGRVSANAFSDALPFVLWVLIAWGALRERLSRWLPQLEARSNDG